MADTGIFGLSEDDIRRLMATFGASQEDKDAASRDRWITMGLTALANPYRGQEFQAIGQGGIAGQAAYQTTLNQRTKDRGAAITQGVGLQKIAKESNLLDMQGKLLSEDNAGGAPSAAPGNFQPGGTLASAFGPPRVPGMPEPGTPNMTQRVSMMQQARNLGAEAPYKLALGSGGPEGFRKAADVLAEAMKPHFGQGVNPIKLNPMTGKFEVHPPEGMSDVLAANERAKEGAKGAYDFVQVPVIGPDGKQGTQMMSRTDAAKFLTAQNQPPMVNEDKSVPFSQHEREAMERDRVGFAPGAIAQHAANAEKDTLEQGRRTGQTVRGDISKTIMEDVRKGYMAARDMAPHLANMEKLDAEGVFSGPAGALGEKAANWINSALPDANVSGAKLGNSQTYRSEIGRMQQAIAKSFPGSQSDKELQALTASLPDLMLSPQGRAQVRDVLARKVADAERIYDSASEHLNTKDTLLGWKPPPYTPPTQSFGQPSQTQTAQPAGKRWVWDGRKMVPQ